MPDGLQQELENKPKIAIFGYVGVPTQSQIEHQHWLQSHWPGGVQQYVKGQQERFQQAVKEGRQGLVARLIEDAMRVGYPLTGNYSEPRRQTLENIPFSPWATPQEVWSMYSNLLGQFLKKFPPYIPVAPNTPTLGTIQEANRAAEAAQQLALQAQGLGLEGQRIGLEAAKMAQDKVDTTRKARARAQLIDEYGKLIDQKWAEKGGNVTQEEAEDLLRRIEASILARANEALENGLTLTDLQQIIDILRMRANLQPKWRRIPLLENLTETVGQ